MATLKFQLHSAEGVLFACSPWKLGAQAHKFQESEAWVWDAAAANCSYGTTLAIGTLLLSAGVPFDKTDFEAPEAPKELVPGEAGFEAEWSATVNVS